MAVVIDTVNARRLRHPEKQSRPDSPILKKPEWLRVRAPGSPVVPFVFIALAILLIVNTIWTSPLPSALGLGMTALGALVYVAFLRGKARPDDASDD